MRIHVVLLMSCLLIYSCAPVKYFTYYEGGHDPLYNIGEAKTIGFVPLCLTVWAGNAECDELIEKQMFVYARDELRKRGYNVFYISPEFLELDADTSKQNVHVKENYKDMPDLILTVVYMQVLGNKVQVPGQSAGSLSWGRYGGGGYYGETEGYEVQTYMLILDFALWSGAPQYTNKAWEGIIKKGSPKLDLFEQAPEMTSEIFKKKFDR